MARSDYTHRIEVNCQTGEASQVDLTDAEIDTLVENETAIAKDLADNGYKRNRKSEYPEMGDQLDMLFHDMTAGKGNKDGEWYKAVKAVKDANAKPG